LLFLFSKEEIAKLNQKFTEKSTEKKMIHDVRSRIGDAAFDIDQCLERVKTEEINEERTYEDLTLHNILLNQIGFIHLLLELQKKDKKWTQNEKEDLSHFQSLMQISADKYLALYAKKNLVPFIKYKSEIEKIQQLFRKLFIHFH
jgi:hypothetical protein